jgi:hypothetical protein
MELVMEEPPVLTADEARQGVTGHNVRYVLIISCVLVVVLFAAVAVFMSR